MRIHYLFFIMFLSVLAACGTDSKRNSVQESSKYQIFESKNITQYSTEDLLFFLTTSYMKWHSKYGIEAEMDCIILGELSRREDDVPIMLNKFQHPTDSLQHLWVTGALYQIADDRILKAFKEYPSIECSRISYLCLNYRAKRGDMEALRILNDNYLKYPVSSLQWSYTVELFGKFNYRPAIPNLIKSLDSAVLNLGDAAFVALKKLFPGPHPDLKTIREAELYFQSLLDNEANLP